MLVFCVFFRKSFQFQLCFINFDYELWMLTWRVTHFTLEKKWLVLLRKIEMKHPGLSCLIHQFGTGILIFILLEFCLSFEKNSFIIFILSIQNKTWPKIYTCKISINIMFGTTYHKNNKIFLFIFTFYSHNLYCSW